MSGWQPGNMQRICSLQPSVTSTLHALGLLDRLVACTRHCAAVVPTIHLSVMAVVEDSWTADAEQIAAAKPDLVIASVPYRAESIAQILKSGTRVLALSPRTLNDIYGDVSTIAALLGVPERGEQVIAEMQRETNSIHASTAAFPRLRVYCEEWGKPMLIAQPWVAELVQAAGGEFVGEPGTATSADEIRASNPDVIVFGWCGAGDRVPAGKLIVERQWNRLAAVRNDRVYVVADHFLTTPAPILTFGLRALAHAIHPELFPSIPEFHGHEVMRTASGAPSSNRLSTGLVMTNTTSTDAVIPELDALADSAASGSELMTAIVSKLSSLPKYNWVGFYMIEGDSGREPMLVLGPYAGAPTPHTRIPLNQGICGAAASSGETVVVDDVNADPRYLACSIETRSEIVVPIYVHGEVAGELDIDSHTHAAFGPQDRLICERAARLVGSYLEQRSAK